MTPTKADIDTIFARIESTHGIAMRSNFLCCQSCGHDALDDEGRYGFYHSQDTDTAAQSGRLYVAFSTDDDDDTSTGDAIATALREAGCEVEWDGTAARRIIVSVSAESFDLYHPSNIPSHALHRTMPRSVEMFAWEDDTAGKNYRWQYRLMYAGAVVHASSMGTFKDACADAKKVTLSLDLDDDDDDTEEE
jgi:hypothetical protein